MVAADLAVASRLSGPIDQLSELERSLLFAEMSMLAYLRDHEAQPVLLEVGFQSVTYVERDGAQAYELGNQHDVVIVCRGTEPNEWNDVKADANAFTVVAETVGRVHRGFKREVDDIWPELEATLGDETRDVWFAGHSLGGAMAQLCAARCRLSHIAANPSEVQTFGSPRVATKRYLRHAEVPHVRWVNNNDIVTRVPPRWLRYRHDGKRMYLDRNGEIADMSPRQRSQDRWIGFRDGLHDRRFDHFSDHAISAYVDHIRRAVETTRRTAIER